MSELGILLLLSVEIRFLISAFRRSGFTLFPTLFLGYIVYCQLIYFLVAQGFLRNDFLSVYGIGGTEQNQIETQCFYAALFVFLWAISRRIKFAGNVREVFDSGVFQQFSYLAAVAFVLYALMLVAALDWKVVWSNSVYLAMTSPGGVLSSPTALDVLNLSLLFPTGIFAACLAGANIGLRFMLPGTILGAYAGLVSLYLLGSHQRGAAVIPIVLLTTYLVVRKKPSRPFTLALAVYGIFAYVVALAGRGSGFHGLASIGGSMDLVAGIEPSRFIDLILTNSAEGIFVFAEALSRPASYPALYQVLSFLPTPSAIDGFSEVRDLYQVRLHKYVPFSGYAEAVKFGPQYVLLLMTCLYFVSHLNRLLTQRSPVGFLVVNALTFSGLLIFNSYPIRTGFRPIWVAVVIALVALLLTRRSTKLGETSDANRLGRPKLLRAPTSQNG